MKLKLVRLFEKRPSDEDGPSKEMKKLSSKRLCESDILDKPKSNRRNIALTANVLSHTPLG